jgi:hypothetical protein
VRSLISSVPLFPPDRCRLGIMISRIVMLTQFIGLDKPSARFGMYRVPRLLNSSEGSRSKYERH